MLLEAVYDHGRLEFPIPVQFKHGRVRLVVNVPDEEVDLQASPTKLPDDLLQKAQEMLDQFEAIRNASLPADDHLPALTAKQVERIEAFASRAQARADQRAV